MITPNPDWTQVSIPSADNWGDYDDPCVITLEGTKRLGGMCQQLGPNVKMAYYFETATEAREWWDKNNHKLGKHICGLRSKIYSIYTPPQWTQTDV